jgi:hypothetical protein
VRLRTGTRGRTTGAGVHAVTRSSALVLLLAFPVLSGCGDNATGVGAAAIVATIGVVPAFGIPGDTIVATVTGMPSGGAAVALLRLRASGLITASDSLIVTGSGPQAFSRPFILPFQPAGGSVSFSGSAENGSLRGTAQQTLYVYDSVPPIVSAVKLSPSLNVQPGDSVNLDFTATDNAGIVRALVQWTGAFTRSDTVATPITRTLVGHVGLRVPANAAVGRAMDVTVEAVDVASHTGSGVAASAAITDLEPPSVTGTAIGSMSGTILAAGDTLIITVNATDNQQVAWVGYSLSTSTPRADSAATSASSATHTFRLPITAAWAGSFSVTAFASDSLRNRTTSYLGSITAVDATRRPYSVLPLDAAVHDIAYDQKRDVLYVSLPDSNVVAVVQRSPLAYGTPILTPSSPHGVDLTLSGDSLVIALRRTAYLGVVDLTATTRAVDTVRLNGAGGFLNNGPDHLRMAANGQLLVTMTFDGSGYGGSLVLVDLAAHVQRTRPGPVTEEVPLAAACDRSRIFGLIDDSCCPEDAFAYTAAVDSFTAHRGTVARYSPTVSADSTGARFLIGSSLFDAALNLQLGYTPSGYGWGPTALAPDGTSIYFGVDNSYVKVRTSDGAVLERVLLPGTPSKLLVLPNGDGLVAVVPSQLVLMTP